MSGHHASGEIIEPLAHDFAISRRELVQSLGAGILITVLGGGALAQRGGRREDRETRVAARIHIAKDGAITVMTGKVEGGQGARTEITQAAAEELRVAADRIRLLMADTNLVPDDGITAGSRTTPSTIPAVRNGCSAARNVLLELAADKWNVSREALNAKDGAIVHPPTNRQITYADLAAGGELAKAFEQVIPADVELTPVSEWRVLGTSVPKVDARNLVTGRHRFPSDMTRPGMLRGKVLRPPSYGAKLTAIDLAPARAMKDVIVVRDGDFVGVAAPTTFQAEQALAALAETAEWEPAPHPSSADLFTHLRKHARKPENPFAAEPAARTLRQTYHVAYVQHAPLEPRIALAEWKDDSLTVWAGTQNPFGYRSELARAFGIPADRVRVIVPDFGGGFGGKHTGEAAVEAARLARAAKKPVSLRWTREEEFTWASFRPAAVIDIEAGLDANAALAHWYHVNINSGGAAIDTPYRIAKAQSRFVSSETLLRQASYRALAATANNFARECFMDELAEAAGRDPLEFRLAHLENPRLKAVLETAAKRFDWSQRVKDKKPAAGVGLACGTEKGSYVAACVEVAVEAGSVTVRRVCQVFECGAILNPDNLLSQVKGCLIMGMGPALWEQMRFEDGRMLNPSFAAYRVPRFTDVPELDIHLLNRPDLPAVGGGETPIIAIAPAIANAVFAATGLRVREMPIRLPKA